MAWPRRSTRCGAARRARRRRAAPAAALHDVAERDRAAGDLVPRHSDRRARERRFQRGNPSLAVGEAVFGIIALMTRPFAPVARARGRRHRAPDGAPRVPRRRAAVDRRPACPTRGGSSACASVTAPSVLLARRHTAMDRRSRRIDDAVGSRLTRAAEQARCGSSTVFDGWLDRHGTAAAATLRIRYACGADLFDLLLTRGHWCDRSRASLSTDARQQLDEALARLDERARADRARRLAGGPAAPARRASDRRGLSAGVSTRLGCLPRARAGARSRHLAGRADPLRADPGSDARCGAVPLLPALPIAGAVRSAADSRLRGHADRSRNAG